MIVGLQTVNICQLRCKPCAINTVIRPRIQSKLKDMDTFKEVIDRMVKFGLTRFDFTPTIGDAFVDSTMIDKLEWMDKKPEVEVMSFFTNLLGLSIDQIKRLVILKKIRPCISCYGCTEESYNNFTQTNGLFKIWERNLITLKNIWLPKYPILYLCIRNADFYHVKSKIQVIISTLKNFKNVRIDDISKNNNFGGHVKNISDCKQENIPTACQQLYIGTQILENGDVTLCGCWDAKQEMIIGNIFDQTFEEIYGEGSKYKQIEEEQKNGIFKGICKYCDDRISWNPDQEIKY